MWPRVVEIMLGCWLAISPLLFPLAGEQSAQWVVDLGAALAIIACGLAAHWPPLRRANLVTLAIAALLTGYGYLAAGAYDPPAPPAHQNHVLLGLLLGMFALIPSNCVRPPLAWEQSFLLDHSQPKQAT